MYFPLNYDAITWVGGHNPPAHVKAYNNRFYHYWERALFQRACSVFDFTLPQETDGIQNIRIVHQTKNVVVSGASLLFCGHVLVQIGDHIPFGLEIFCAEGRAGGCHRI